MTHILNNFNSPQFQHLKTMKLEMQTKAMTTENLNEQPYGSTILLLLIEPQSLVKYEPVLTVVNFQLIDSVDLT